MKRHPYFFTVALLTGLALQAGAQHGPNRGRDRYDDYRHGGNGPRVTVVASLPHGAIQVVLGGSRYHYYGGRYYCPYDRGYRMVLPPVGIIIPSMPPDCRIIVVSGRRYYYYDDVYYVPVTQGYQVVSAPPEEVAAPPAAASAPKSNTYEKIVIDGRTYYRKDDAYFKAVIDDKGEVFYEKVGEAGR